MKKSTADFICATEAISLILIMWTQWKISRYLCQTEQSLQSAEPTIREQRENLLNILKKNNGILGLLSWIRV